MTTHAAVQRDDDSVITVEAGSQMFGIPLRCRRRDDIVPSETIGGVGAAQLILHRNRTIPVFDLANLLRVR